MLEQLDNRQEKRRRKRRERTRRCRPHFDDDNNHDNDNDDDFKNIFVVGKKEKKEDEEEKEEDTNVLPQFVTKLDKLSQKLVCNLKSNYNRKNPHFSNKSQLPPPPPSLSPPSSHLLNNRGLDTSEEESATSCDGVPNHWYGNRTQVSIKADRQIKEYFYHCIPNIDYPMRMNYCWDFSPTHGQFVRSWAVAQRARLQELRDNFNNLEEVKSFRELVARRRVKTRRRRQHQQQQQNQHRIDQTTNSPGFLVVF